jgi:hypothetical protein
MLVDNKFIIIMIPRCATTSFLDSCQILNIKTNEIREHGYTNLYKHDVGGIHYHYPLYDLQEKFGYNYPVIAVKRDKGSAFISLWKQTIGMLSEVDDGKVHELLKNLSTDDILFFNENDYNLLDIKDLTRLSADFCDRLGLEKKMGYVGKFLLQFIPQEWYHNNDPNIIWFDFNQMDKLEEWVSDKLNIDFKLTNINSSTHWDSNLQDDEYFRKKFNKLYGSRFEEFKKIKTLI